MNALRPKVSLKCECGTTVFKGSVFCPHCRAEINRKNAKVIRKDERNHQKMMRSQGRKSRKKKINNKKRKKKR